MHFPPTVTQRPSSLQVFVHSTCSDVARFTQDGVTQSVPVNEIQVIQQVTGHTVLHGAVAVGICALVVGGIVLLFKD